MVNMVPINKYKIYLKIIYFFQENLKRKVRNLLENLKVQKSLI